MVFNDMTMTLVHAFISLSLSTQSKCCNVPIMK